MQVRAPGPLSCNLLTQALGSPRQHAPPEEIKAANMAKQQKSMMNDSSSTFLTRQKRVGFDDGRDH